MACVDPRDAEEEKHAREGMAVACVLIKYLDDAGVDWSQFPTHVQEWRVKHLIRDGRPVLAQCLACNGTGKFRGLPGCVCGTCLGSGKVSA